MDKLREAARQALEALRATQISNYHFTNEQAITALREALKPNREGKYYYKDNACTADNADSPDCICWHDKALAEQAEQRSDSELMEPVGVVEGSGEWGIAGVLVAGVPIGTKLYAAPVRTKDLTEEDINELWNTALMIADPTAGNLRFKFARAVIAADRELNK